MESGPERSAPAIRGVEPRADGAVEASHLALLVATSAGLSRSEAEDVAQEVALRLLLVRSEVRNPGAWARSVARTVVRDTLRRKRRESPLDDAPEPWDEPLAALGRRLDLEHLIRTLDERSRVLVDCVLAGLSHVETAERIGVATSGVGTLVRRARESARARWMELSGLSAPRAAG